MLIMASLAAAADAPAPGCCTGLYMEKPGTSPPNNEACPKPFVNTSKFLPCQKGTNCHVFKGTYPDGDKFASMCVANATAMLDEMKRSTGGTVVWSETSGATSARPSLLLFAGLVLGLLGLRGA